MVLLVSPATMLYGASDSDFGSRQALFEGAATLKPPALPEDTYSR